MAGIFCDLDDAEVLAHIAQSVQLQRVEALAAKREQVGERSFMRCLTNLVKVPERVVQDKQDARFGVQIVQQRALCTFVGPHTVVVEALHPRSAICGR